MADAATFDCFTSRDDDEGLEEDDLRGVEPGEEGGVEAEDGGQGGLGGNVIGVPGLHAGGSGLVVGVALGVLDGVEVGVRGDVGIEVG